ncbi:hypothetical protein [Euzebya tangerina]|uniref:hypothetical protein n=1 Tax=Euzebya tangerina TaxID=591198 RepID=UPI000E319C54|nr:hypothetical protein [Euzebya tangerina]
MSTLAEFTNPDAVLADTRRLRKRVQDRHRKATLGDQLYQAYLALFIGIPLVYSVTQAFDFVSRMPADQIAALDNRIAAALPIALAMLTIAGLRLAAWTGPVVVARADVAWLFSLPFARRRLITPRLGRAFVVAAVVGALAMVGLAVSYLLTIGLDAQDPGVAARLLGTAAACGAAYGLLLASLGWLVEVHRSAARLLVRAGGPLLIILGAALALVSLGALPGRPVVRATLASGPWGWATAALLGSAHAPEEASTRLRAGSGVVVEQLPGVIAAGVLVGFAVLLVAMAWRRAGAVPLEELRRRSATSAQVTAAAVYFADFRGAAQARDRVVRALIGRSRRRLPMPRRRQLLIPWIGLTVLLRQPRRIVQAALWLIGAAAALGTGIEGVASMAGGALAEGELDPRLLAVPLAVGLAYAAAGVIIEPLRVEDEQRFALRTLPEPVTTVGPAHLAVPAVVLWVLATAVVAIFATVGWLPAALGPWSPLVTAAMTTILISAAAVPASGPPADGLWLYSGGSGYGRLAFHLLRGPLLALIGLLVPVVTTQGRLDAGSVVTAMVWAVAVAVSLGSWVQRRLQKF